MSQPILSPSFPVNGQATAVSSVAGHPTQREAQQLQRMRPTLVVGVGGSGQKMLTFLKLILKQRYDDAWQQKIRLLAFDTTEELFTATDPAGNITLEPTIEFINIGNVPVPGIMRNLDNLSVIQERLGPIMASLPPVVLRNGARQIRPFGLLSLLWNYKTVSHKLNQALWFLAGRDQLDKSALAQQQGINVFICGSMVGGTGSGTFLDLAHLIRNDFDNLGTQAEFCHITGIGLLHQAFHGIWGPNLLPNAGAALEELHYLMCKNGFKATYPDGRIINSQEAPYNLYYVIDGVDELGQVWPGLSDVCQMVAQGLFLQIGSQLGREGENAFDNMNDVLTEQSPNGEGSILSSFGLGHLVFAAPAVADLHTHLFLRDVISQTWLATTAESQRPALLAGLDDTQLPYRLQLDPQSGSELRVDLTLPGWLKEKPDDELPAEAARYVREYGYARIAETFLPRISQNGEHLAALSQQKWAAWLKSALFAPGWSLPAIQSVLEETQNQLAGSMKLVAKQIAEYEQQQAQHAAAVSQLETAVAHAAQSFFWGRANRIGQTLTRYFQAAQRLYESQVQHQTRQTQQRLWHTLSEWIQGQQTAVQTLTDRLHTVATQLDNQIPAQTARLAAGGVATLSLATPDYVQALYQRHKPALADAQIQLGDALALAALPTPALRQRLLDIFRPGFQPVADMHIEQVIRDQADEMTPNARRQQLFRLATPSWNIDRARLPHGGDSLVRLEVLGVPDEAETLFNQEPMRVSTHDPHRLTALTVVAGAPPSALRQYGLYQQAMKRVSSRRPLHVLPDFLTNTDQGRLMFALGSIFGLIYSQGTFFYYRPADPLHNPFKLANGLHNAIEAFIEQEGLAYAVSERIEAHIASLGLPEAINLLTSYYSTVPDENTALATQLRELKQLVRTYTEGLRQIDAFSVGIHSSTNGNQ